MSCCPEESAGSLVISPASSRHAYMAWDDGEAFVVDDAGQHCFHLLIDDTLVSCDDGQVWACLVGDPKRRRLFMTVENAARTSAFDWSELMRMAWQESVQVERSHETTEALREWVKPSR